MPAESTPTQDRRKLRKTATPGVYRKGNRYIVMYWASGEQRKESCRTLDEARRLKRARETDDYRGEFQAQSKLTLHEYALEWIDRYQGKGRGFRESTRDDYRRILDQYTLRYFPASLRLTDVTPMHVARHVGWLADATNHNRKPADTTIRNCLNPLRALLATAVREGLLRHNPAAGLALPHHDKPDADDEEQLRVLTRTQLHHLLTDASPPEHRTLFHLLAGTGLRISEAIALRWSDLYLEADPPYLRVCRALVKQRISPPKTKHGRRRVPLSQSLADDLTRHRAASGHAQDDDYVFTTTAGTPLDPGNHRHRVLKPAVTAIGAAWASYHTFRHTYASLQLAAGVNLLQLSRALGHHSPAFTLDVYTHLLEGEHAPALELGQSATRTVPAARL